MERASRVHVRCGKEEEAQALAAGECNQVAGFCFTAQVLPWLKPLLSPGDAWLAAVWKVSYLEGS